MHFGFQRQVPDFSKGGSGNGSKGSGTDTTGVAGDWDQFIDDEFSPDHTASKHR